MQQRELELLFRAIRERYGYDFRQYEPGSIRRRVQTALAKSGCQDLTELRDRLLESPAFFVSVLDDLTVQVSDMFRDPSVFRVIRERVVPVLRTYPYVKIWHAGCASGEEVYTMAIVLHEEGLYERAQIYATDTSMTALGRAREGVYPQAALPRFAEAYRDAGGARDFEQYCVRGYGSLKMRDFLCKNVVFFQHDLVTDYSLGEMHLIFCRNVLIYFGTELRQRVVGMFGEGLYRGGFLCLGSSECLPPSAERRFFAHAPAERIYQWRGEP